MQMAGGFDDVQAISIAAQQHGMVCLDGKGNLVRPALLWNDLRSSSDAHELISELGSGKTGKSRWVQEVGTLPVASLTITKLRWLARHEPHHANKVEAVCLPHDWLTWKLKSVEGDLDALTTDRSDASGTGYWSPIENCYKPGLLEMAFGRQIMLPKVLSPYELAGVTANNICIAPGAGDNAGAALGIGMGVGDVAISIGTSGVIMAVSARPAMDISGAVAGFADATGHFLPLVCTVNAARITDAACKLLGVDHAKLYELAMAAPPGAEGLTLIPYFEGERTPDRPSATGTLYGMKLSNTRPDCLARAFVEGMLCSLADGIDAIMAQGIPIQRLIMLGGASRSEAVCRIASQIFGFPVETTDEGEHVADGAAWQAARVLSGGDEPPIWDLYKYISYQEKPLPAIKAQYAEVRDLASNGKEKF
jgi:xylulokinase